MEKVNPNVVCYIGIGSNLGDRRDNIARALALLRALPGVQFKSLSHIDETAPIGPVQPPYLNAVAAIETELPPHALLDRLQQIESTLGRVRREHWGPRTIDLDILFYGDQKIQDPRLTVPHPEIEHREFLQRELREAGYRG